MNNNMEDLAIRLTISLIGLRILQKIALEMSGYLPPQHPTRKQVKPLRELESDIDYIVTENRKTGIDDETLDMVIDDHINEELEVTRNYLKDYANRRLLAIEEGKEAAKK